LDHPREQLLERLHQASHASLQPPEGSAAPQLLKKPDACAIPVIVGIVDSIYPEE
jgi:hypothetical protein